MTFSLQNAAPETVAAATGAQAAAAATGQEAAVAATRPESTDATGQETDIACTCVKLCKIR